MSAAPWAALSVVVLFVLATAFAFVYSRARTRGWSAGYLAGQQAERQAVSRWLSKLRKQASTAERAIDYLYEGARRQIQHLDSPDTPPNEKAASHGR